MNYVSLSERLRMRMSELGMSQRELAERAGLSTVAVHKLVSGKAESSRKLVEIAEVLGCSSEWLQKGFMTPVAPDTSYAQIPVLDVELPAGSGAHIDMERVTDWVPISRDWIQEKQFSKDRLVVVTVTGDSMTPRLQDGDTLLVNTADQKPASGNIYAIAVDNELRVKRLMKRMDGAWVISSDNKSNPAYQDEIISSHNFEQLRIIGRAVKVLMGDL